MYDVILSKSAAKDIGGLPQEDQDRIIGILERICISPHRHARKLKGTDEYRIRIGKNRIIIGINERLKRIEVLRIGNRENVYL
jgi:mRNA-degrading endonuclease RelE of RelBE toxin-antitoxin system